ncbi:MAG: hypothetical protein CMJ55_03100 [Planctomycetaceae bacterium]|nr:hypothetical protein [Planctomycetaceae bacterium]
MAKRTTEGNSFKGFRKMAPGKQESVIYSMIKEHADSSFATKILFGIVIVGLLTAMVCLLLR